MGLFRLQAANDKGKGKKVKVVDLYSASTRTRSVSKALRYIVKEQHSFTCTTYAHHVDGQPTTQFVY